MAENGTPAKPRLVFFQYRYDAQIPSFLLAHTRDHVRCLEAFFDVVVVSDDGDYGEVLDRHTPDVALFELGVPFVTCRRPRIAGVRTCNAIPKVGLLNADSFCESRSGVFSDVEQLGVEAVFSIATAAPSFLDSLRDELFVWPNSVDPVTFRDYGEKKAIPVLFTGNAGQLYPWRRRVKRVLELAFPSASDPHPGYQRNLVPRPMLVGEAYARRLGTAWFVPTCGTAANEVVRKHFEIPACGSCLLTQQTPALEEAGFVDMQNCAFVDDHDAVERVTWLLDRPEKLRAIIEAGRRLIQTRHTMLQRDEIRQWFELRKRRRPGDRIVQSGAFGGLRLVGEGTGVRSHPRVSESPLKSRLEAANAARKAGDLEQASAGYRLCLEYVGYMPEPTFGLGLCSLYQGNARAALSWLTRPLAFALGPYDAEDPDPLEWTYFLIALVAGGRLADARRFAHSFPELRHTELARVQWAINAIALRESKGGDLAPADVLAGRRSLHEVVQRPFKEWVAELAQILVANGRTEWAVRVKEVAHQSTSCGPSGPAYTAGHSKCEDRGEVVRRALARWRWRRSMRDSVESVARSFLHAAERRFGYFLPYRYSAIKHHPLFVVMRDLFRDQAAATTLVVSDSRDLRRTAAISIAGSSSRVRVVPSGCVESRRDTSECIFVDLTGRDTPWEYSPTIEHELLASRIILVIGSSRWKGFENAAAQWCQAGFRQVLANAALDGGCAVYQRGPATGAGLEGNTARSAGSTSSDVGHG